MFNERRAAPRYQFNRHARIQGEMGASSRDCLIIDMSETGVRLHAEVGELPADFTLMVFDSERPRRACRVVWRLGFEIGARFTDIDRAASPRTNATSAA